MKSLRMKQNVPEDPVREKRIDYEIVVDAYDEIERSLGWYYYLDEQLSYPFSAKCVLERVTSPLAVGEEVEVLGMPSESDCENEMLVLVKYKKKQLAVPLAQLECLSDNEDTLEAMADWHYWIKRGYQF